MNLLRLANFRVDAASGMDSADIRRNRVESWECPTCLVRWVSTDPHCWICGHRVEN